VGQLGRLAGARRGCCRQRLPAGAWEAQSTSATRRARTGRWLLDCCLGWCPL
jgi:hypothetical protein